MGTPDLRPAGLKHRPRRRSRCQSRFAASGHLLAASTRTQRPPDELWEFRAGVSVRGSSAGSVSLDCDVSRYTLMRLPRTDQRTSVPTVTALLLPLRGRLSLAVTWSASPVIARAQGIRAPGETGKLLEGKTLD